MGREEGITSRPTDLVGRTNAREVAVASSFHNVETRDECRSMNKLWQFFTKAAPLGLVARHLHTKPSDFFFSFSFGAALNVPSDSVEAGAPRPKERAWDQHQSFSHRGNSPAAR